MNEAIYGVNDLEYRILKDIYRSGHALKVSDLSERIDLPHTTIASAVKRLESEKLVKYKRYGPVSLNESGIELAEELIRHTRLLEVLLCESLGLSKEEARSESEKFNLLFSCNTINKICEKYNHPKKCPCGDEIPQARFCHCKRK